MAVIRCVPGTGLGLIRRRIAAARSMLLTEIPSTLTQIGVDCASALSQAAPRGTSEGGAPPPGDAGGALADSFVPVFDGGEGAGMVTVKTTQPTKLTYVRYGTGIYGPMGAPILPKVKQALYWPGADHPVRSVRGQRPNDFVTPVVEEFVNEGDTRMDELGIRVADLLNGTGGGL